ncbi:glucan biosynthesis protein [Steroidobacter sp. S1-65]|uniref:Glucan biosynthesis protein n=1 Tax=Steroidobacter gossypii TaxID=2805490 RepID=A0ABS1X2J5_9GAMM|nr:glucan biosynthesis protein [Steroidobacter gossypii]MBM0107429.1 glucan biosynthesis protein [Steroidobacter gossypii]
MRRYWLVMLAITFSCVAGAASTKSAPETAGPSRYKFTPATVVELARRTAASAYTPRRLEGNPALQQLSYDQYRDIRFKPEMALWRNEQVPFRVELLPAGFLFQTPVKVSMVESGMASDLVGTPNLFALGPHVAKLLANQTLPLSGFRVRTLLNSRSVWDEFMVFQGATYFRAVPRGGQYGISARGLAIRTAHPSGEEFPAFTQFWVERPGANASGIVVHALLDSPSVTGGYRFSIQPGTETVMDVDMTLFPRVDLDNIGLGPLTSMFLFDESERTRIDDFRDEVHDSDGLQVVTASGERLWRPLRNPTDLQVSAFTAEAPRGFGLVQRSRRISDYRDFEAKYELRPSVWIEPTSDWGKGSVDLVEIPTENETNDNIVAFFRPHYVIPAGKPWHGSYRMRWNNMPRLTPSLGRVTATRTGPTIDGKRRIFVIDFFGAGRNIEGLTLDVGASAGKVSHPVLHRNPLTKGVRASFELDPAGASLVELRLRLLRANRPITETWLYRWTAS